tara:strand:+ start:4530 stop:5387 length:858 start_codon:yes stop_codon:yes gene_type:complete
MTVEVGLGGNNLGNDAFQYFSAYIYCKKHSLELITKPANSLLNIFQINYNKNKNLPNKNLPNKIINSSCYDHNNEIIYYGENNYLFKGFFQNAEYINNNYTYLLENVKPIPYMCNLDYQIHDNDILCILRIGDFIHEGHNSEIVHPDYFLNILKSNTFDKVFFLIWPPNDNESIEKYLNYFKEYNVIPLNRNRNELFDFHITDYFKNLAFTNSTFNWWSCFFTKDIENKTIYMPKLMGSFGIGNHLRPHGNHVKNLWNIRNTSIPIDNKFINLKIDKNNKGPGEY